MTTDPAAWENDGHGQMRSLSIFPLPPHIIGDFQVLIPVHVFLSLEAKKRGRPEGGLEPVRLCFSSNTLSGVIT